MDELAISPLGPLTVKACWVSEIANTNKLSEMILPLNEVNFTPILDKALKPNPIFHPRSLQTELPLFSWLQVLPVLHIQLHPGGYDNPGPTFPTPYLSHK